MKTCPKCGETHEWRVVWCPGSPLKACPVTRGEHLHLICPCTYSVVEPCKDATS